jgi:hypothetical protein
MAHHYHDHGRDRDCDCESKSKYTVTVTCDREPERHWQRAACIKIQRKVHVLRALIPECITRIERMVRTEEVWDWVFISLSDALLK